MAKQKENPFRCEVRIKGQTEPFAKFKFQSDARHFAEWSREVYMDNTELWQDEELILEFKKPS